MFSRGIYVVSIIPDNDMAIEDTVRIVIPMLLMLHLLVGCTSSFIVSADETRGSISIEQLNIRIKDKTADVVAKDGTTISATIALIRKDSTFYSLNDSQKQIGILTSRIDQIVVKDGSRGAEEGLLIGIFAGGLGFAVDVLTLTDRDETMLAGAVVAGMSVLMVPGFAIAGSIQGHTDEYIISIDGRRATVKE